MTMNEYGMKNTKLPLALCAFFLLPLTLCAQTLSERIPVPQGYVRTSEAEGSLGEFLRAYTMKPVGSSVLLYDGSRKWNQRAHCAVFALPIENYDLQQCADSVMRVYAEWLWRTGQEERIRFHFTNGFLCEWAKWKQGFRVKVSGNKTEWVKSAQADSSYKNLVAYLKMVFTYAGTASMRAYEAEPTTLSALKIGDVFL